MHYRFFPVLFLTVETTNSKIYLPSLKHYMKIYPNNTLSWP